MKYSELLDFLTDKMRLSHIYQPVMIKSLLSKNGELTDKDIAAELLKYDISQIEYYQNITNNMDGRVLRNREVVKKVANKYQLPDFNDLQRDEISNLIKICDEKIMQYIEKRGEAIWQHRKKSIRIYIRIN
jgi:ATP adenylyltransferase